MTGRAIPELGFWPVGRHSGESKENRSHQAPENSNGTRNTETGERWVSCKGERGEPAHCRQTSEQDGLQHAGNVMLNLPRLLPDQYNVYPVVHADC